MRGLAKTLVLSVISSGLLSAACAGGGVTMRTYTPTWTPPSEAVSKASATSSGVIVYAVQAQKQKVSMWDEQLETMSKTVPFVELCGGAADDFARKWKIESLPAVAISDAHGNILWSQSTSLSPNKVQGGIATAKAAAPTLEKDLNQSLAAAKKAYDKAQIASALQKLDKILKFDGYAAVSEAKQLREKIIAEGLAKVDENKSLAATDSKQAKEGLRALSLSYRSTPVADQASAALKDIDQRH